MKISLTWLRDYVDLPETADEVGGRLTSLGFPVEGKITTGPSLDSFVVGRVVSAQRHPNADKLTLCQVDVGGESPLQIICGAPNAAAGVSAAVALIGAVLPDGTQIKKAKLRGVESQGMLLSERELGLSTEHQGIIDFGPGGAPPGTPLSDVLGAGDTIFDIDIASNRGDGFSHVGIARELAVAFDRTLRLPQLPEPPLSEPVAARIRVSIDDPEACPRYLARVITGVTVGPSPEWLVRKLTSIGQRSISNVVDVTNFILWELGQPLHAFDADRLEGNRIIVRRARTGEKLTTLDGVERLLSPEVLVIADAGRPVALAGIMGGADTEVTGRTTNVLLEGAVFDSYRTLLGAAAVRLTTDASLRFIRGVDPAGVEWAIDRAAFLLAGMAGGTVLAGRAEVTDPAVLTPRRVTWRQDAATRLLGEPIGDDEAGIWLSRLGFQADEPAVAGQPVSWVVPSHRPDVREECDMVEEVARFHGYERLTDRDWNAAGLAAERAPIDRLMTRIRETWVGLGFTEMLNPVLTDPESHRRAGVPIETIRQKGITVPESQSMAAGLLRLSLLPGALASVARNQRFGRAEVRFFEVGPTYQKASSGPLADEPLELIIVATGGDFGPNLTRLDPVMDELRFKGHVEAFLLRLRVDTPQWRCYDATGLIKGTSAIVESGKTRVGEVGTLDSAISTGFDIQRPIFMARFDVGALLQSLTEIVRFREASRFPASRRDLAFLIDESVAEASVHALIRSLGGALVTEIVLFDRYVGTPLPAGKVSLAYALRFQAEDRTLSDEDLRAAVGRIASGLSEQLSAELRDG
ncbi:MAG: phenylalanine--tRNA ligase subunit beta [Candidatus Eisenbacteria bacterium]|nr:phenylalanine--tRNA ligase subunit beta [Candidatus Eisenbacteria bacterium]